jgi:tetratricopeptide (TPR) repeat protein
VSHRIALLRRSYPYLLALLAITFHLEAQMPGGLFVKGELLQDEVRPQQHLTAELVDGSQVTRSSQPILLNGTFSLSSIQPGRYELRINDAYGDPIARELVSIEHEGRPLQISLPKRARNSPVQGTISAAALKRRISAKAVREMVRSEREFANGHLEASIIHLHKAIRAQPDYMEAYNNLGTRYMKLNDYDNAVVQFRQALRLDSTSAFAQSNLGLALVLLNRLPEAEAALRGALLLDATFAKAHYMLGLVLIIQQKAPSEALEHLDKAAGEVPEARLKAAGLLVRNGRSSDAASQLRRYLASAEIIDREGVESWLAILESYAKPPAVSAVR